LDDLVASYEFDDAGNLGNDSFVLDGPVVRVRRDSDNVEREVGFDGDTVDTQALTDFANGGNVYVVKIYDQTTGTEHKTQSTQADQPQIVSSGSVLTLNGNPYIEDGGLGSTDKTFGTDNAGPVEANSVIHVPADSLANNVERFLLINGDGSANTHQAIAEGSNSAINTLQHMQDGSPNVIVDDGTVKPVALKVLSGGDDPTLYVDDMTTAATAANGSPNGSGGQTHIMQDDSGSKQFTGKGFEFIFYPDVDQSRRKAIASDQKEFYT
jgi:hypothetical protein